MTLAQLTMLIGFENQLRTRLDQAQAQPGGVFDVAQLASYSLAG